MSSFPPPTPPVPPPPGAPEKQWRGLPVWAWVVGAAVIIGGIALQLMT